MPRTTTTKRPRTTKTKMPRPRTTKMPRTPKNKDADYYDAKEPMRNRVAGDPHLYSFVYIQPWVSTLIY